jgi:hypothetical protein
MSFANRPLAPKGRGGEAIQGNKPVLGSWIAAQPAFANAMAWCSQFPGIILKSAEQLPFQKHPMRIGLLPPDLSGTSIDQVISMEEVLRNAHRICQIFKLPSAPRIRRTGLAGESPVVEEVASLTM